MPDWRQIRRAFALLCVIAVVLSALLPGNTGLALCVIIPFVIIVAPVSIRARRIYSFVPRTASAPLLSAAGLRAPPQF
jgi:hypothetical protein